MIYVKSMRNNETLNKNERIFVATDNLKYQPLSCHLNTDQEKQISKKISTIKVVGTFISSGVANGRDVYQGALGGLFHMTKNFSKTYLSEMEREHCIKWTE